MTSSAATPVVDELQDVVPDDLTNDFDIDRARKLEPDLAESAEPHFELTVPVEPTSGLDRPRLDFGVGQRRVVGLLAGDALNVTAMIRLLVK